MKKKFLAWMRDTDSQTHRYILSLAIAGREPHIVKMEVPIAGWKFVVELPQSSGDVLPRVIVVRLPERDAAAKAVWQQFPGANFRVDYGQARTANELDSDLGEGNGFLLGERVRITDEI